MDTDNAKNEELSAHTIYVFAGDMVHRTCPQPDPFMDRRYRWRYCFIKVTEYNPKYRLWNAFVVDEKGRRLTNEKFFVKSAQVHTLEDADSASIKKARDFSNGAKVLNKLKEKGLTGAYLDCDQYTIDVRFNISELK